MQKLRHAWIANDEFKDWILITAENKIKCKFCNCLLVAKKSSLSDHMNTKEHAEVAKPFGVINKQLKIPFEKKKNDLKIKAAEAMISLYVARHTSINVVDHLISCFDIRILSEVKLVRTKCSAIIRNVIYPYFKNQLREDIGNSFFSLIIDESTDIGVFKYLGIVIKIQ